MPMSADVDEFLEAASGTLPRITEIIFAFPAEHRAGALQVAECRYRQAAWDFGCAEADPERLVAAVMRKLRTLIEQGDSARETVRHRISAQPIDTAQVLNLSAGVSIIKVLHGRSLT